MIHIPTGRGAAYNKRLSELTVDSASAELVRHALAHHELRKPWSMDSWLPLPSWVTQDELAECELFWVHRPNSTRESVEAIPDA